MYVGLNDDEAFVIRLFRLRRHGRSTHGRWWRAQLARGALLRARAPPLQQFQNDRTRHRLR